VMVIGADKTPYPVVTRATAAIGPSRLLGVVLNRAAPSAVGAGYGYGYGYRYSGYSNVRTVKRTGPRRWFGIFGKSKG
jgi:hypothetical protein